MRRYALLIEYDGTRFHGSQAQGTLRTVQGSLEQAFKIYFKQKINIILSGRTDSGVHAEGQVAHFDYHEDFDLNRLIWAINGIVDKDLAVRDICQIDNSFHSRFKATARMYRYQILNAKQRSALKYRTHFFIKDNLDFDKMLDSSRLLLGTHDFSAFKSSNSDTKNNICHLMQIDLKNVNKENLEIIVKADHFVYNMVRIIVGTLVQIGLNKIDSSVIKEAFATGNRKLLGPTAPPWGLSLQKVYYPDCFELFN